MHAMQPVVVNLGSWEGGAMLMEVQETLEFETSRLASMANGCPIFSFLFDRNGHILVENAAASDRFKKGTLNWF